MANQCRLGASKVLRFSLTASGHKRAQAENVEATGEVVQDFSLDDEKLAECRIEDVDDDGLLIGKSNHHLAYYERTN